MKKLLLSFSFFLWMIHLTDAQNTPPKKNVLESLLKSRPDLFSEILQKNKQYEIQLIYTQINRDAKNVPSFTTYTYGLDKNRYFYPASTVKFPIALLALEKLNQLKIKGLDRNTTMITGAARKPQEGVIKDSTSANGLPSIAHYVKKLFVVSDNDASNRLFEFVGQKQVNEILWKKGYRDLQIYQRLSAPDFDDEANRYTNPITFMNGDKKVYEQAEVFNPLKFQSKIKNPLKGMGYLDKDGKLIKKPFDFKSKNMMTLPVLHEMLKAIYFPKSVSPEKRFNLSNDDLKYVQYCMSILPRECKFPNYDEKEYPDGFVKFVMYGDTTERIPQNIRIFNKVGSAYGFLVENAYVVDFEAKTEFMISGIIYVNEDQIFNDNKYQYKEVGLPFLANLGRVIAWHEKNRPRKFKPNLDEFKFKYEEK
jgi:hypothetical protein